MSVSVRVFVEMMLRSTEGLPDGLDTKIELGICNGAGLQYIGCVDIGVRNEDDGPDISPNRAEQVLLLRGHLHPNDVPRIIRVRVADLDQELRGLIHKQR